MFCGNYLAQGEFMCGSHAAGRKLVGRLTVLEQRFQSEAAVNVEIASDSSCSRGQMMIHYYA